MTREIAGEYIIVPTGDLTLRFNGLLTINETGYFIWQRLKEETDEASIVQALTEEYEISVEEAEKDVREFLAILEENRLL